MSHIKSRKHPLRATAGQIGAVMSAIATGALPGLVHGQTPGQQTLPAVKVQERPDSDYKAETSSNPKLTQPLLDTTQTITVIRKEVLQEQGAASLTDALRNTPGVTLLLGEGGNSNQKDNIFLRGFDTSGSVFIDGVRDLGNFPRDVFNLEQIEVMKGASGSEFGRGAPSGSINMATKAPLLESLYAGSVALGTDQQRRATADVNQRLGATSAIRLNAMVQDRGIPGRDEAKQKGWAVAPSIGFGLGTATRTTFDYVHVDQNNRPDGGVPTVGLAGYYNAALSAAGVVPPGKVNPANYYGSRGDFERVDGDMLTGRIEHNLTPTTVLRNTSRIAKVRHDLMITGPSGVVSDGSAPNVVARLDPATWTATRSRQTKWQENTLLTNQTNVSTKFSTGGLEHALNAGVEVIYEKQLTRTRSGAGTMTPANLGSPDPSDPVAGYDLGFSGAQSSGDTLTLAAYAFDTLKINEQWSLNAGLRLDKYRTEVTALTVSTADPAVLNASSVKDSDTLASWRVGAQFKPAVNGSIYAAYSTSQLPPGGANFTLSAADANINNPNRDPQKARSIEVGTKWDLLANRLALTAAVFRTENENDLSSADPVTGEVTQYGKKRVQGIELGAVGAITPAWNVSAGLVKLDTKVLAGSRNATGVDTQSGSAINWSPDLAFTAWTTYRFRSGLTIGGGARYLDSMVRSVSNTAVATTTNMYEVPSYWVFDAMASYAINRNLSLQLNLYNLSDKEYVATLNNNGNRYIPGPGRSAMLTATLRY